MPKTFEVEITQTQRFFPLSGWGKKRLPTDRYEWADRSGKFFQSKDLIESIIPRECEFVGDWRVWIQEGETDADGWQYALDFPQTFSPKKGTLDFVRRRFWRRTCQVRSAFVEQGVVNCPAFEACIYRAPSDATRDLGSCKECNGPFSMLNSSTVCGTCNKEFCFRCIKKTPMMKDNWTCKRCLRAHHARQLNELEHNAGKTAELEAQIRAAIESSYEEKLSNMKALEAEERGIALELSKSRGSDKNVAERNRILEKWQHWKEPRQGLVRLTVVNAMGVHEGNLQRRLRATVKFPGLKELHGSALVPTNPMPDFHVTAQALLHNDTEPIVIAVEEFSPKFLDVSLAGIADKGTPIMAATLKLSEKHPGIVQAVTESLVFIERGCAVLRAVDPQNLSKPLVPEASITVKWTFEVREVEAVGFCDNCGRMKARCTCK